MALKIFCLNINITNRHLLGVKGPVLITANHPNSFLDAVIIGSGFRHPVHFLARGDAFNKPWHNTLLRLLNMIPVYRLSEGKENLSLNEEAFRRSKEILSLNGIVLIFIEGISAHTYGLQTFKKGAARIAIDSKALDNFSIMPLGIAYDSFDRIGKKINISIGKTHEVKELLPFEEEAKNMRHFNTVLYEKISRLINIPVPGGAKTTPFIFFIPAVVGYLLHIPLYAFLKKQIRYKTRGTVFYDSVLFGALLVVYPPYLLIIAFILFLLKLPAVLVYTGPLLHPITAWFAVCVFSSPQGKKK